MIDAGSVELARRAGRSGSCPGRPGVEHACDGRVGAEALGEHPRGLLLGAHAKRQRAQAAVQQIAGHRVEHPAGGEAHLPQGGRELVVAGHDAAHHIAVSAQVLGRAVQHDPGPVLRGPLEDGGGEGVVHEQRHPEPQEWASAFPMSVSARVGLAGVSTMTSPVSGRIASATPAAVGPGDPRCRAVRRPADGRCIRTADGPRRHGAGPWRTGTQQHRGQRRHSAGEGHRALGRPLEPGQGGLEAGDAGLPESLVDRGAPVAEVVPGGELLVGQAAGLDVEPSGYVVEKSMTGTCASARSDPGHTAVHGAGLELRRRCLLSIPCMNSRTCASIGNRHA